MKKMIISVIVAGILFVGCGSDSEDENLTDYNNIQVPVPELEVPEVNLTTPRLDTNISVPQIDVDTPTINQPSVDVPEIDVDTPSVPEINVTTPEIEIPEIEIETPEIQTPKV